MLLGIQIIPRINGCLQSQSHATIVWQCLVVALCVSLWTLSGPRLLPRLPLIQPLSLLPVLVYCLLRTLASRWNKQKFRCYEAKIEESEKAGSRRESNPGHLACAASALPLSYDNRTTTSPHNPLYVLHRWD